MTSLSPRSLFLIDFFLIRHDLIDSLLAVGQNFGLGDTVRLNAAGWSAMAERGRRKWCPREERLWCADQQAWAGRFDPPAARLPMPARWSDRKESAAAQATMGEWGRGFWALVNPRKYFSHRFTPMHTDKELKNRRSTIEDRGLQWIVFDALCSILDLYLFFIWVDQSEWAFTVAPDAAAGFAVSALPSFPW